MTICYIIIAVGGNMKKVLAKGIMLLLICAFMLVTFVACNYESKCISTAENAGYTVEYHRDADDIIDVAYTVMTNENGEKVYIVAFASVKEAKGAFGDGLLDEAFGNGMKNNPNIPKGDRFVFYGTPYAGYGDGAVRVGNSIVVAPMDVLQSLEKNKDKILTKNAA